MQDTSIFGGPLQYSDLPRPEQDPLLDIKQLQDILKLTWVLSEVSHKMTDSYDESRIYVNYDEQKVINIIKNMDHEKLILLMFNAGRFFGHTEIRREIKKILQIP